MQIGATKRLVFLFGGVSLVALLGWLLLPFFVSTDVVRNAIERSITEITGQKVSVGESAEISLFPTPTATLKNITIAARGKPSDATPIAELDEIQLDIAVSSLLTGKPRFSSVRLIRPMFNLDIDPENALSDQLPLNNVRQAVRIAGEQRDAERGQEADQATAPEGRTPIIYPDWLEKTVGIVAIEDGSLVLTNVDEGNSVSVNSIDGTLNWPRIEAPLVFEGAMIVDGQTLTVSYSSPDPIDALAGEIAQSKLDVTSSLATMNVTGEFGFASGFFAIGDITLETPSVQRLLAWRGRPRLAGRSLGALQLSAQMQARGQTLRLNDLTIDVDGNAGTGVLEIARRPESQPTLVGTLDFGSLDLRAFLSAFTNLPRTTRSIASVDTSFMDQLQTDLRISAATATFDDISLTGVAATAQTTADLALFDLGDATAFGGAFQARLRFDRNPEAPTLEMNVSGENIDMNAAIAALDLAPILPTGSNNFSWTMSAPLADWSGLLKNSRGKVMLRHVGGSIAGFGPDTLAASDGSQFTQIDVEESGATFQSFVLEAPIIDGELKVNEALVSYDDANSIVLNGVVQLSSRSLALTARTNQGSEQPDQRRYFIGGGWKAPYIFGTLNGPPLPLAE